MARSNQATKAKRDRERLRQERQQDKNEKKATRTDGKADRERLSADGVDPDLVGIVAGPQPQPEDE